MAGFSPWGMDSSYFDFHFALLAGQSKNNVDLSSHLDRLTVK